MQFFKFLLSFPIIYCLILISTTHLVGCQKTVTVHDTTTIHTRDTLNTTDTLTIRDTVNICNCNYDLKDGLIGYYNFNGGNLNDSSGFNNHIIFNNASLTTDRFGVANNAYLFNGSSNYMQVKNSVSLNPDSITLFAIVKVNGFYSGPCAGNDILLKGSTYEVTGIYSLNFFDFTANCGPFDANNESFAGSYGNDIPVGVSAYSRADSVKIKTGQWYSIAYTFDRNFANFYVNGVLKNVRQISVDFNPNSDDLYFGKNPSSIPYPFNGVIDEIRIYKKALCAGAIKQLSTQKIGL